MFYLTFLFYTFTFDIRGVVLPVANSFYMMTKHFLFWKNTSCNPLFHRIKQGLKFLPFDIGMFSYTRFTHFRAFFLEDIYEFSTHQ